MSVRRLLAVSWDMPPMSGPRAVQVSRLLKHLVPLGWESTVICFGPRSTRYHNDPELAIRLRSPGVRLVHVPSLEERLPFRALWRIAPPLKYLPDEKRVWIGAAARAALRAVRADRFDAIVSFAQPWSDHLVGSRLQRATGLPWVAHFSDPWVDSPYGPRRAWQRRVWQRMEASVVKRADALVFVNRQTADRVMEKYPDAWRTKAHVVPHGFEAGDVPRPLRASAIEAPLHIVHTGRFYDGTRTPLALLGALASLSHQRPLARELRVTFVGPIVPAYRRAATALGLDGIVEFAARVPAAEAARRAAEADVLLVVDAPAVQNLFLPSKLVDYLPFDKPILALTPANGATADLVRDLAYPTAPPDDEAAIAATVAALLEGRRDGTLQASAQHRHVAARYDIRRAAAAFAEVLAQCA
jgi:glycosyltransferase involved in cell wall biosynthesis